MNNFERDVWDLGRAVDNVNMTSLPFHRWATADDIASLKLTHGRLAKLIKFLEQKDAT